MADDRTQEETETAPGAGDSQMAADAGEGQSTGKPGRIRLTGRHYAMPADGDEAAMVEAAKRAGAERADEEMEAERAERAAREEREAAARKASADGADMQEDTSEGAPADGTTGGAKPAGDTGDGTGKQQPPLLAAVVFLASFVLLAATLFSLYQNLSARSAQQGQDGTTQAEKADEKPSDGDGQSDDAKAKADDKDKADATDGSGKEASGKAGEAKAGAHAGEGQGKATKQEARPVSVTIAAIGDMLMHQRVTASGLTDDGGYDFSNLLANVSGEMSSADIRVANQETPIAGAAYGYSGYPSFNGPFEVADAEAAAGVNVVTKATNHTLDRGYDAISTELGLWHERHPEVAVIGAADPSGNGISPAGGSSPAGPYILDKDGFRVAVLNYTDVLNAHIDESRDPSVISIADEARIRADVDWAKKQGKADAIVALMHWGEEYEEAPVESERHWASLLASLGVDVIIGGHPHVIQPVEEIAGDGGHRTVVFWSVGNFTSTQTNNRNMIGLLARATLTKDGKGKVRVSAYEALPTVTHRSYGRAFTTYLLRDYTDDLAAENLIREDDPVPMSVGWCQDYCSRVLGDAYDRDTCSVHWEEAA